MTRLSFFRKPFLPKPPRDEPRQEPQCFHLSVRLDGEHASFIRYLLTNETAGKFHVIFLPLQRLMRSSVLGVLVYLSPLRTGPRPVLFLRGSHSPGFYLSETGTRLMPQPPRSNVIASRRVEAGARKVIGLDVQT